MPKTNDTTEEKPKRLPILKQPVLGRPDPITAETVRACTPEEYELLTSLGFQAVRSSADTIVFDKKLPIAGRKEPCQITIRCENKTWQCTLVFVWDTWDHKHDAFFSARHNSLKELMQRVKLSFHSVQEFLHSISEF